MLPPKIATTVNAFGKPFVSLHRSCEVRQRLLCL